MNSLKNARKAKSGVTLIELIIAMAMMVIISVATIGLASYIVRYYRAVNDNATAKNIAMMNIEYVRDELLDAKEVEVYSGTKQSSTDISENDVAAILSSEGSSQLIRQTVIQGASGHAIESSRPAISIVTGEDGKSDIWSAVVVFKKPGTENEALLDVTVEVSKSGEVIDQWTTTVYLPNVEINPEESKRHVVFPADETEGTHVFYIKGLVD